VVVDVDLEKFFDRVNHDVLMGKLAHRIEDRRLLGLIRRYLEAGVMADGVVIERQEGSPQGGPLSPLLANVLLDEVDRELEQRGHAFARYADDLNVYVGSMRAGERVMRLLRKLFYRLRLRINEAKSAVAPARERKFLGFSFWRHRDDAKLRVAPQAIEKLKERIRKLTLRTRGRSMATIVAELREIGDAHDDRTPSQVALRWLIQKGAVPIPGAKNARQAEQNAGALGWALSTDELARIDGLAIEGTRTLKGRIWQHG
jgi:group II intron reverse transcriptase/maturase